MSTDPSEPTSVEVTGPADGEPIVFVHGTIFNRTMWAPQRDALADRYRVIAPDLPGHGGRRDEEFDLEAGVEAVARAVEREAGGSAHLVGLSLGGYVATAFARRHPDRVDDLVISGSSANPVGLLGVASRIVGGLTLVASRSGLVERATDWLAARYVRSRDLDREAKSEIVDAGFDLRPFGRAGVEIAGQDFRRAFAGYPGPALVLNGQGDVLMRLGEDDHADAARDARVEVVEGAGHSCNLDRPEEYTAAVERFVAAARHPVASD